MAKTLLLVDDERNVLRSLVRLIQKDGYEILIADSGSEALRLLVEREVQVVVADLRMPGMSGAEFLHRVKEIHPEIVLLALGAPADSEAIAEAVHKGSIYKLLNKPWDEELLRKQIKGAFRFQELVRSNTRFSREMEHAAVGIVIADADGVIQSVNPAFSEITGRLPAEVLGRNLRDLAPGARTADLFDEIRRIIREAGHWHGEIRHQDRNGRSVLLRASAHAVRDRDSRISQLVFSLFRDGDEAGGAADQVDVPAYYDSLTSLPNRLLFVDRLRMALAQAKRNGNMVGVIFLNLDRFRGVNDTLGHDVGDELLGEVAIRIVSQTRREDTVARLGGDQFTILVPRVSRIEDMVTVARKLLAIFKAPFLVRDHELFITPSLGIGLFPDNGTMAETLIRNADTAMSWAKEQGGNCYSFFTPTMHATAFRRLNLVSSLHRALEKNQLLLYYQPQVDLGSGHIAGVEALVRWHDQELGMVPPGQFIPIAEESGLIVPIGAWTLHSACRQAKLWYDRGYRYIRVAVNLSARLFVQQDLLRMIQEALEVTGLEPACLEVEITETILMQNADATVAILDRLKGMGIQIAMDDFGTGYSSLSYLKRFPIDVLKIDQSFIRDVTTNPDDAAIVTAIVAMAHSLKLKVLAEGVESAAQAAFLHELGCNRIQGFLISPPVKAADLEVMIAAEKERGQLTLNDAFYLRRERA